MPKLGETVTTGTVTSWLRAVGDTVGFDDPLLEVATDKVDSEIPAARTAASCSRSWSRRGRPSPSARSSPASANQPRQPPQPLQRPQPLQTFQLLQPHQPLQAHQAHPSHELLASATPRATAGPCSRRSSGSWPPGTASTSAPSRARAPPDGSPARTSRPPSPGPVLASGPRRLHTSGFTAPAAPTPAPCTRARRDYGPVPPRSCPAHGRGPAAVPDAPGHRRADDACSLRIAPHVWTAVEVDLQAVEEVRRQHKERFRREEGTSLTYLAFVARAACDALRAFPVVNSSLDMAAKTRVLHLRPPRDRGRPRASRAWWSR